MVNLIQQNLSTAQYNLDAAMHDLNAAEHNLDAAEHTLDAAMHKHNTAMHKQNAATELNFATTELEHVTTELKLATTELKHVTTRLVLATTPYEFAIDCLQLSMYFFHPIQQCAQQVYHTAVPLSPTSSQLYKSCLQSVTDNKLSHVAAFSGAPSTWGLLLRTVDFRPRQLTCITTSVHGIISACGNIVDIYGVYTGVLQQSLCAPESVEKIQHSPDGSILFFVHSSSVTMWDVQTGGHIHTFSIQSKISDIAVSANSIACSSSDGSVTLWGIFTKERAKCLWSGDPVVTIHWLSHKELVIVTQSTLYVHNFVTGRNSDIFPIPGHVWGMVYLDDEGEILVGTSQSGSGVGQEECFFVTVKYMQHKFGPEEPEPSEFDGEFICVQQSSPYSGQLSSPMVIENKIACITQPNGVQLFDTSSNNWTNSPSLLGAATSVAMSYNQNLVVQTKDSIQIFTTDALASGEAHNTVHVSHLYPLGENHIICVLQSTRNLTLLELETLQELYPDNNTSPLESFLTDQSASAPALFGCRLVAEFGISEVVEMWQSSTPLPEWTEATEEDAPLCGWLPEHTLVIKVYGSPQWELRMEDPKEGITLASLPLEGGNLGVGDIYNITFDLETRFHLKIDGPGGHIQIPYDITASPSGGYSHTITKGEPVPLLEPRERPPYTLDVNCEWVLDAKSRKVCWISPGDIRRGNGGHFWAGSSLIMVGGDGVVRKVTFKDPDL